MRRLTLRWFKGFFTLFLFGFFLVACRAGVERKVVKVAAQSPLSGEQAALGEQIKLGAQLAVQEFSERIRDLGFEVEFVPFDDQAKPEVGVANARRIVADPDILLVIGHLNSGVAIPSSEIYKDANLAMISPANTHPSITDRNYPNVNRVCGRDDVQGPLAARFAAQDLRVKTVYIIHDKTLYGQGIADAFRDEAGKLGLKILGYEGTEERANFDPIIIPIRAKNPDLVYFGGIYHQGGLLLKQMREKGVKAIFIGPDGLDSSEMVNIAGSRVVGTYYTTVAGPINAYPEAAAFAEKFKQRFQKDPESFGIYAYDATAIGLRAIEMAIKEAGGKKPTRDQVSRAVRMVKDFQGITGIITFDSKGDPVKARYFVLKFESAKYPGTVFKTVELQAPPSKGA